MDLKESTQNVTAGAAVEVIKNLAENVHTCLMMTELNKKPISVRPMAIQKVDDSGSIYFFSSKESHKNLQLKENNEMQITIQNEGSSEYMSLYGKAISYRDQKEIDEMYSKYVDTWFKGKEDPDISIIRFDTTEGYYWDTKHGKLVQMAGFLYGAVTGARTDDSLEGKIKL